MAISTMVYGGSGYRIGRSASAEPRTRKRQVARALRLLLGVGQEAQPTTCAVNVTSVRSKSSPAHSDGKAALAWNRAGISTGVVALGARSSVPPTGPAFTDSPALLIEQVPDPPGISQVAPGERAYLGEPAERGEVAVTMLAPLRLGEEAEPVEARAVMVA